jgi:hypothetical protein
MWWGHFKILFLRTLKPEKMNFTWKLPDMEQRQDDYIMGPRESNGANAYYISTWTKFTQVSDVAHGPLVFKNFDLGHNVWLVGCRAFIFHTCIPSGKTFHLIQWPWPLTLEFDLFKNFNFGHNSWLVGGGFSYFICVFLLARHFIWYHDLDLWVWPF